MLKRKSKSIFYVILCLTLIFGNFFVFTPMTASAATPFAYGSDVSWLPQMEANGYVFFNDSGVQQDCLTILKAHGTNSVRLRTFVNPSSDPVDGHCSQAETIALAVRCKAAGLRVLIDLHFGDTWNSVGKQNPPAAWASMTYTQMLAAMTSYVSGFMTATKTAGVSPEWVQIGNEENLGICTPTGSVSSHPDQMTGLLNAAYDQVKAVFPSTQVVIHLAQPQNQTANIAWYDAYVKYGGKWDVIGFSSYPSASYVPGFVDNIQALGIKYGKKTMIVETGGVYTNPTATYNTCKSYIDSMQSIGGLGVFYWEPEMYSPFDTYTMSAWDPTTKKPTTAIDSFIHTSGVGDYAAVADSYVRSGTYAATNYGTATTLTSKNDTTTADNKRLAYFKFNVTSATTINTATLKFTTQGTVTSHVLHIYGLTNTSWTEDTINWNNAPNNNTTGYGLTGTGITSIGTVTNSSLKTYSIDVTSFVKSQTSNIATFVIVTDTVDAVNGDTISPREGTTKPILTIQ